MPESSRDALTSLSARDDLRVSQPALDVRGWQVRTGDGAVVGTVDDLLVDPAARRVRYLRVRVADAAAPDAGGEGSVLIPVGLARLDDERDEVIVPVATVSTISMLERHQGNAVVRDYEIAVRRTLLGARGEDTVEASREELEADAARAGRVPPAGRVRLDEREVPITATGERAGEDAPAARERERDDDYYAHPHFDERRFLEPRVKTDERDFLEHLAVTSISADDEAPEMVGEVQAGPAHIPIMQDRERREGEERRAEPRDASEVNRREEPR